MFEELNERRKAVECNIAKGFGIDDADLDFEKALEDEFEKGRAKKTFAVGDTFTRHEITYKCTGISANTGRPTWSKVKDGEGSKQEQPEKKEEQPKQEQKKRSFLKPDNDERQDCAIEWLEFDKNDRLNKKRKEFDSQDKARAFINKISEKDNFYQITATSGLQEEEDSRQATKQSLYFDEYNKMSISSLNEEVKYLNRNNNSFELKIAKKVLSQKKKEREEFLENTSHTFTDEEVGEYLSKYNLQYEPSAIVENTWKYAMGRIGSTKATISLGNGKPKSLSDNIPNWRPIGEYSYTFRAYNGYEKITGTIQSWDDVKKCLSDTESFSIKIFKHPKQ